jgi:hypothetical protein
MLRAVKKLIDGTENGVPAMITVCKGCSKKLDEAETSMCIHCLAEFCDECVRNGLEVNCCQQAIDQNQKWDAEEAAASIRELELLYLFSL